MVVELKHHPHGVFCLKQHQGQALAKPAWQSGIYLCSCPGCRRVSSGDEHDPGEPCQTQACARMVAGSAQNGHARQSTRLKHVS